MLFLFRCHLLCLNSQHLSQDRLVSLGKLIEGQQDEKTQGAKELSSIMTRRMLMVGGSQLVLGALVVGGLYQLQISQTDNYRRLSDRNQFDKRLVQAPRGRLLDVRNRLLAGNSEVFELRMLPSRISDMKRWLNRVGKIVEASS